MNALFLTVHTLVTMPDQAPAPEDVKAGWGAFAIFLALAVAVALLGWSLVRHLRKAESNAQAGAFGPPDGAAADERPAPGSTD